MKRFQKVMQCRVNSLTAYSCEHVSDLRFGEAEMQTTETIEGWNIMSSDRIMSLDTFQKLAFPNEHHGSRSPKAGLSPKLESQEPY